MAQRLREYALKFLKPLFCLGSTYGLYCWDKNQMMLLMVNSCNLADALTGILTFTTLILGFIGVLLPAIMSMKRESELVEKFFKRVPPKQFSAFIRNNILSGLALTGCVVVMFFAKDLLDNKFQQEAVAIGWITLCIGIYFVITTFCVLNLLLRLLIEDRNGEAYPKG